MTLAWLHLVTVSIILSNDSSIKGTEGACKVTVPPMGMNAALVCTVTTGPVVLVCTQTADRTDMALACTGIAGLEDTAQCMVTTALTGMALMSMVTVALVMGMAQICIQTTELVHMAPECMGITDMAMAPSMATIALERTTVTGSTLRVTAIMAVMVYMTIVVLRMDKISGHTATVPITAARI